MTDDAFDSVFVDPSRSPPSLTAVQAVEPGSRLGGLLLSDLGVLRDHAVALPVPMEDADGGSTLAMVRVPELGAFLVHKGATFRRRSDPALRQQLARSLSVRHRITQEEGDARARGFLADFLGLIPA